MFEIKDQIPAVVTGISQSQMFYTFSLSMLPKVNGFPLMKKFIQLCNGDRAGLLRPADLMLLLSPLLFYDSNYQIRYINNSLYFAKRST